MFKTMILAKRAKPILVNNLIFQHNRLYYIMSVLLESYFLICAVGSTCLTILQGTLFMASKMVHLLQLLLFAIVYQYK